jgi:gamma-glutamyltranspeptidase/glutathione hydrolase
LKFIGRKGPHRSRVLLFTFVAVLTAAWQLAPVALAAPPAADAATQPQAPAQATTRPGPGKNAVSSAYPLATEAGLDILAQGGNAFDAAVAVSAALNVVEPRGSGLGGGGFYLLHRASDGMQIFVDAREVAPAAAKPDMYLDSGGAPVPGRSTETALAAGIPGEPAAWAHLAQKYGRLPLSQSMQPAIRLAREGFPVYPRLVDDIRRKQKQLAKTPDGQRIFLRHGEPPQVGEILKQTDLSKSLEALATRGPDEYYRGALARRIVAGVRQLGGIWSAEDLAGYKLIERPPLVGSYRTARGEVRIVTAPPPSSGGVAILNSLNILSGYDLARLQPIDRKHLIVESLRRVHRDRAEYFGDPDFVSIPLRRFLSPDYAAGQRASIRFDRATPSATLPGYVGDHGEGTSTTHFNVLDRDGNRVAGTITLNAWFGSGLVVPGTGILLNNEMDDFAIKPGVPNIYGLVGAEANEVAPRKRPLSSMAPTFLEAQRGIAMMGSPGGSVIPTLVLLGTLNWINGADAIQIVAARRIHHQYMPDLIWVETEALTDAERETLASRGHQFRPWPATIGNMHAITWDYEGNKVVAGSDPRGAGKGIVR